MNKICIVLVLVFLGIGCATTKKEEASKSVKLQPRTLVAPFKKPDLSPELKNIDEKKLSETSSETGVIFGKTDFEGVLEKSYVRLLFENQDNLAQKYQLHIGDKTKQTIFPWSVETVKPGYFYIELPSGNYKISSISIPVGSTMATETSDINVRVVPKAISYIGTLKVDGIKEKIRLGGVPIIRPGFEYVLQVIDERTEGMAAFHERYPQIHNEILINLMQANSSQNTS